MDILEEVEKYGITAIHLQFLDIHGNQKVLMIPPTKLPDTLESGVNFDGSSIPGFAHIEDSDMTIKPDPDSFFVLPWTVPEMALNGETFGQPSARLLCDVLRADGTPFEGDSRYILKRHLERAEEMGFYLNTGPEVEFYLFDSENRQPSVTIGDTGGYFDPLTAKKERTIKEIVYYLDVLNFDVEAFHHEVGPSQYEIDLKYADALSSASKTLMMKSIVKTIAAKNGLYATFMPKPVYGIAGNGMHINQSLMKLDGDNAFYDPDEDWGLSSTALSYLAGLLEHARENCGILASHVNSYKRLVAGYEAPIYVSWANRNRSALLRIPAGRGKATRIEQRNPDPAGNIYLQYAVLLASGLDGMERKLEPPEPIEKNIYHLTAEEREKSHVQSLPGDLGEALDLMEGSAFMWEALGETLMTNLLSVKRKEFYDYRNQVTPWEIEHQLPVL